MRTIVNISLPEMVARAVEKEVKKGGFASKSEFFRHILRERSMALELENDRHAFKRGRGKLLTSLHDLR